jgi:hypothetical protein
MKTSKQIGAPSAGSICSAKPCSQKSRKHLPWAIAQLEKMETEETDPKLRALWRNAAQLGRESLSPNIVLSDNRNGSLSSYSSGYESELL